MSNERPRLLFVCSRNKRRSLTAEHLLRRSPHCTVRSVGTAPSARVQVREPGILWADVVFVMEQTHVDQLRQRFRAALADCTVTCLDIPDDFVYMDADLVDALSAGLSEYLA